MDRITRKQLKSDEFAIKAGQTVEFFSEHRQQVVWYGAAGIVAVLLVLGVFGYRSHQRAIRENALDAALEIQNANVGPARSQFVRTFPSEGERNKAAEKAFRDLAGKYSGTNEGTIAEYYLGVIAADEGKLAEAEKHYKQVVDSGNYNYASIAELALADIYKNEGKLADGEKLLRALIANPSDFVSKDQATIALARLIASSHPEEARNLLLPLRTENSAVSRVVVAALGEISQMK